MRLAGLLSLPAVLLTAAQEPAPNGESFELFRGLQASRGLHFSVPSGQPSTTLSFFPSVFPSKT